MTGPDLALSAAAVAVALLVVARAGVRRWRAPVGLRHPDPAARVAAVERLSDRGLDRQASLLLRHVRAERDLRVLDAVAAAVARRQWEPEASLAITGLRAWAVERLGGRTRPPAAGGGLRRQRVLVTGAGGPAGTAVVEALHGAGHHVVAADADPAAVGLRLAPAAVVLPRADDPAYVDALLAACVRHGVTALVATVAEELEALAGASPRLGAAGVAHWLPDPAAVRRCTDKWAFAKALAESGVAHPATGLGADPAVPGPWIVKPRSGRGSRHVTPVDDAADLERATRAVPDALTQTRVEGREWTVDLLVAPDGSLGGASPRWRLETRGGISTTGETFEDPVVTATALAAMTAVGLTGVANVQGFTGPDGAVTVVEVNPRFSGGLPLTLAAGCDVVGEHLRVALGGPPRPARLHARPGVRMHRWFSAVFEEAAA